MNFIPGQRYLSRSGRSFRLLGAANYRHRGWRLEWAIEHDEYDMRTDTHLTGMYYSDLDMARFGITEHNDDVISDAPYLGPRGVGPKYVEHCMVFQCGPNGA